MKKAIFVTLITTLTILILFYFYDQRETILNKQYSSNTNKIHIEYPYFHNQIIDNYIKTTIEKYQNNNKLTFIDYDYQKEAKVKMTKII